MFGNLIKIEMRSCQKRPSFHFKAQIYVSQFGMKTSIVMSFFLYFNVKDEI